MAVKFTAADIRDFAADAALLRQFVTSKTPQKDRQEEDYKFLSAAERVCSVASRLLGVEITVKG